MYFDMIIKMRQTRRRKMKEGRKKRKRIERRLYKHLNVTFRITKTNREV